MAETIVTPAQTASNIAGAIQDKVKGATAPPKAIPPKATEKNAAPPVDAAAVDPNAGNAGKEKYVVDGKEIWLTPDQARAYVQKGISFEPRVSQMVHLQRETAELLNKLKTDPLAVLFDKRVGHTPEAVIEQLEKSGQFSPEFMERVGRFYYDKVVRPAKMTPEQRAAEENERKLKDYEAREASAKDMAIKQENERRVSAAMDQIKANIAEAMKESGLPTNDTALGVMMARRVADVMRLSYLQRQAITPKQAIARVKGELKSLQTAWYDNLDEDQLVAELGEKNAEKVKKYYLKLVKDQGKVNGGNGTSNGSGSKPKFKTRDEFFDHLQDIKRGG